MSLLLMIWVALAVLITSTSPSPLVMQAGIEPAIQQRVPVTLGVMSKCPDARVCENVFDSVLDRVGDIIDLRMLYIARVNSSESAYGVTCLHGPDECKANIQQLCIDRYANDEWQTLWRYINCISYGPISRIGNEEDAARCTKLVGLDYEGQVKPCVDGPRGASLLRQSARNAEFDGIEKSCSIYIDGELACVHDGTWKQCDSGHTVGDFVTAIREAYRRLNK